MDSAPAFPWAAATAAPAPGPVWGDWAQTRGLPTNAPWQNFVLNEGTQPETALPYSVRLQTGSAPGGAGIQFGRPLQNARAAFILQAFIADLLLTTVEGLLSHRVASFDDMSVTLAWRAKSSNRTALSCPLVRGSPYLTFIFPAGRAATPKFSTIHAVTGFWASATGNKHRIELNNGQTWLVYSSTPLLLGRDLVARRPFTGVIRVALLPGSRAQQEEAVLDWYAPVYPLGGEGTVGAYQVLYQWKTASWTQSVSSTSLLMLTLPVHRRLRVAASNWSQPSAAAPQGLPSGRPDPAALRHSTLDGIAAGIVGPRWTLAVDRLPAPWYSRRGLSRSVAAADIRALKAAVSKDAAGLGRIRIPSSYFCGKALARAARIALIADELKMPGEAQAACAVAKDALSAWLNGTFPGNALLYDPRWGGVVTRNGAMDSGADFGAGLYNDHHFHFGYFLYASAVVAKMNPSWGRQYRQRLYSLARDYLSPTADGYFPKLRHFDFYSLHSWASGLFEFADGRNQESSSEAVHAYYAGSLLGAALGDVQLATLGATLAAVETVAAETLWHISNGSLVYPAAFASTNRVVGVLWANKRDSALWFAPAADLEKRTGIQVLPVTPYTVHLFRNSAFARGLVQWTLPALASASDEWRGFTWALQAVFDADTALRNIKKLGAFDDGNSLSNLLWFALTLK